MSGTALCAVLTAALAVPFGAWAQATERGGMWAGLRLTERFLTRDTTSPDPAVDGRTIQAVTDIDLSYGTETRTEAFTLEAGAGYAVTDGPATDGVEGAFLSPNAELRYEQAAASASIMVTVTASRVDLADVSPLSVSDSSGEALPSDVADLQDGGTRTQLGFNSRLTLRDDAPFGIALGLRVNDIGYADLPPGSGLEDSTTARGDVTGRFEISPVLQATLGTHYTYSRTDEAAQGDRYGLSAGATLTRPNGAYTLAADRSDGDGGAITALSFGRSVALPQTEAGLVLGVTQATDDTLFVTGSASLDHAFGEGSALGPLTLSADRSVSLAGRSNEELITSLSLGGSYALTPLATLRLTAELGQAEAVATGDTVTLSEVGLSLGYDFGRDWRGAADIRAKSRDPSDEAATASTTFAVSVTRSFDAQLR